MVIVSSLGCAGKNREVSSSSNDYDINAWERVGDHVCRAEEGYYIFCDDFLYTTDSTDVIPLCNKADCNHKIKNVMRI